MMYARMKGLVLCIALLACAKQSPPAADSPPQSRAAAHLTIEKRPLGPIKTTPQRLFHELSSADVTLADRYRDGARFTATIKTVGEDERGRPVVWIDVDGENLIALDFAGPPPSALRAGASLTVTCQIGSASGALMVVTACTSS